MKRILVVLIVLVAVILPVSSQDLSGVQSDLSSFLGGLGSQMLSLISQNSLLGDGIGDAEIGDFPHMALSLIQVGAVFADVGPKAIVDQTGVFQVLNFPGIISQAMAQINNPTVTNLYNGSGTFFLAPNMRLTLGAGIAGGVEVIGQIFFWPQGLTDGIASLANVQGLTFNVLNAGLRVRKVLLKDSGGFPAISLGAGFVYSNFQAGYGLGSLPSVSVPPVSIDFSTAKVSLETNLYSAGLDVSVSKRLLFFEPYLRLSSWYQWGSYDGKVTGLSVTVSSTATGLAPESLIPVSEIVFIVAAGFDLKLGPINLNIGGSFNPKTGDPAAEVAIGVQW